MKFYNEKEEEINFENYLIHTEIGPAYRRIIEEYYGDEGRHFDGYKIVEGRSVRKFTDTAAVEKAAKDAGYMDIYNKSLITLTAFEKLMGKEAFKEILGKYVEKPKGKLTLVPVSDKRLEVTITNIDNEFTD